MLSFTNFTSFFGKKWKKKKKKKKKSQHLNFLKAFEFCHMKIRFGHLCIDDNYANYTLLNEGQLAGG